MTNWHNHATDTNCASLIDSPSTKETPLVSIRQNHDPSMNSPIWRKHCDALPDEEEEVSCDRLSESVNGIKTVLEAINGRLQWQSDYERIQREWGQLARVVERLLMIAFIIGTITFAALVTVLAVPVPFVTFWS